MNAMFQKLEKNARRAGRGDIILFLVGRAAELRNRDAQQAAYLKSLADELRKEFAA